MWICPSCQSVLTSSESQWRCKNNHSHDIAKEGYVNLLLANQKSSKNPGDNKAMVNARRQFLEQGHYHPLALSLAKVIHQQTEADPLRLYDAGCGEGFYLQQVSEYLVKQGRSINASGSDISKPAVQKAAKKYTNNAFAVASSFSLPVAAASQDVVMQIFAPASNDQMHRILCKGGLWLQVTPAENHLAQLKQALYKTPEEHLFDESIPAGFIALEKKRLSFDFLLADRSSREQLLMMTPFFWTVEQGELEKVLDHMLELTADFTIRVLQSSLVIE
jgi:23S rRNA (guanine745-N1)-methyltransferase